MHQQVLCVYISTCNACCVFMISPCLCMCCDVYMFMCAYACVLTVHKQVICVFLCLFVLPYICMIYVCVCTCRLVYMHVFLYVCLRCLCVVSPCLYDVWMSIFTLICMCLFVQSSVYLWMYGMSKCDVYSWTLSMFMYMHVCLYTCVSSVYLSCHCSIVWRDTITNAVSRRKHLIRVFLTISEG